MRVYHFRDAKYGLQSIKQRRLKIARIMDLNDPFEFLGVNLSDQAFRDAMITTKKKLADSKGLLCFSKNFRNPVQWSHYAHNHTGICMGFEIPKEWLVKVNYVNKRLPVTANIDTKLMLKFLSIKFIHWKYEDEYRLFINLDKNEEENGLYFANFSKKLKLIKVIVGSRSDITRKQVSTALGHLEDDVEVYKSRPAFKTFSVVRNKNEKLWI